MSLFARLFGPTKIRKETAINLVLVLTFCCGCWSNATVLAKEAALHDEIVRHFVALKFKESAKPEQVQAVVSQFKELQQKIPFIVSIECGANISTEHLNKGFTHAFLVTFKNAADRDRYLVHPEHKHFVSFLKDSMEEAFVFDFSPAVTVTEK